MSLAPGDSSVLAPAAGAPRPLAHPGSRRASVRRWPERLLDGFSTYLPLLLMALLALGTWWLVKSAPLFDTGPAPGPPRHEPDYTMTQFMVQRFAADGAMRAQLEGDLLRHYPDTDTIEIDNPRIRAVGADGRVTLATARRALANGDGSEVQLMVDARVLREATARDGAIEFRGEFLHAFLNTERVRSHLPVVVSQGGTVLRAAAMEYDNLRRVVEFRGRTRAAFAAPSKSAAR